MTAPPNQHRLHQLSREIATIEDELDRLVVAGAPPEELERLQDRLAGLIAQRQALRHQVAKRAEGEPAKPAGVSRSSLSTTDVMGSQLAFEPPVADMVVEALETLGASADGRLVSQTIEALQGMRVPPSRIAVLRRDDERAFRRTVKARRATSIRPVLVCPAIHFDRLVPVKGRYALSSWDPPRRVVGPRSARRDHLEHVLAIAALVNQRAPDDPGYLPLARLLWLLGRTVAGALVAGDPVQPAPLTGGLDPNQVAEAAERELAIVGPADDPARTEAAHRLAALDDPVAQLFGAPDLHVVGVRES